MSEEILMRKYHYGYIHSKDLLNEPYVKDLQQENQQLKEVIEEVREVIKKMIHTGYMLEKDNSAIQFMATGEKSEFGIRAEVLLKILDKENK